MLRITKPRLHGMYAWEWAIVIALDLVLSGILLRIALALCSGG